jgi:hypothetical protein
MRRCPLHLVSGDDVVSTVRFGDDAFVVCAEDTARGVRDVDVCVADRLWVWDARVHEAAASTERLRERMREAFDRRRCVDAPDGPIVMFVKPGAPP